MGAATQPGSSRQSAWMVSMSHLSCLATVWMGISPFLFLAAALTTGLLPPSLDLSARRAFSAEADASPLVASRWTIELPWWSVASMSSPRAKKT